VHGASGERGRQARTRPLVVGRKGEGVQPKAGEQLILLGRAESGGERGEEEKMSLERENRARFRCAEKKPQTRKEVGEARRKGKEKERPL